MAIDVYTNNEIADKFWDSFYNLFHDSEVNTDPLGLNWYSIYCYWRKYDEQT